MVVLPTVTKDGFDFYGYSIGNYLITDSNMKLDLALLRSVFGSQKNLTLTAKYIGVDDAHIGDYYKFGSYPQSKVKNISIIEALKSAKDTDDDGYLNYENDEYEVVYERYSRKIGYFKVEPIVWEVKSDGTLVSSMILDSKCYNYTFGERTYQGVLIYGNNYKYSTIRAFLNGYNGSDYGVENFTGKGFYDLAFTQEEKAKILETIVDNSAKTTYDSPNQYVCENTNDKIYLMSFSEMRKTNHGYKNDQDRMRKGTDYAIARGLDVESNNHSYYWTRSPSSGDSDCAWYVRSDGDLRCNNCVSSDPRAGDRTGVLPALKISK